MLLKYVLGSWIVVFILTGCSVQEDTNHSMKMDQVEFHVQKWSEDLTGQDKQFVEALIQSINSVQSIMIELEVSLQEMQQQDEYHEAEEMMKQAKQNVLYHWNQMHNEYKPEHSDLRKIKDYYEQLLTQYGEGMSLELEGMETSDPMKMKLGYQKTVKTIEDLKRFKQEVMKAFPEMNS